MSSLFVRRGRWLAWATAGLVGVVMWVQSHADAGKAASMDAGQLPQTRAALTVQVLRPQLATWPVVVSAHGAIAAWQEAIVGAELSGLRLSKVAVNVGDRVSRGQALATLNDEAVLADVHAAQAAVLEAQSLLAEARANADRARALDGSGALSHQEALRVLTAEQTATARVNSAQAQLAAQTLRLHQTRIVAPDDGVISSRQATVGAVVQAGQELFRLIRQSRLEWRAELTSADLQRVRPGMPASVTLPGGTTVEARVRVVAPTVDPATRNGIVYVDLPASAMARGARAGMYAAGEIDMGHAQGLTLPQTAVIVRDGFSYVFRVQMINGVHQVVQLKVQTGRRMGDRIEILRGLGTQTDVVAAGLGFLSDGDVVRVVGVQP